MKKGGAHIAQLPVALVVLGLFGKACRLHLVVFVEAITGDAIEQPVGLNRVDMNELVALAMPQAMLGALRITTALRQRTIGLGHAFSGRHHILANQHPHHHQHQHRLHHGPDDTPQGHTGGTHDGQLAVAGQTAQTDKTTNQGRHRQHFIHAPRRGQHDKTEHIQNCVAAAEAAHLIDHGKQQGQAENNPQHSQNRQQHTATNVAVELNHGPSPRHYGD